MIFDLINSGADVSTVISLFLCAFVCGFSVAKITSRRER